MEKNRRRTGKKRGKFRKLGTVLGMSSQRNLIVRMECSEIPKLNSQVFDKRKRRIGFIFDIIGPVSGPYAVVKCEIPPEEVKDEILYVW
ncbi:MAG: RNA-binding protein [Archaeoglobi archaeon]|nr:RNA-binding protein [Archaeoglobi archaeon]MDK2782333.1 RNA-binding protein [Archaeoglobi archaeon]